MDIEKLARESGITTMHHTVGDTSVTLYTGAEFNIRRLAAAIGRETLLEAARVCAEEEFTRRNGPWPYDEAYLDGIGLCVIRLRGLAEPPAEKSNA